GLLYCWLQSRGARKAFGLTLALALALSAVGSLLLAWLTLHLSFIWLAPLLLFALLAWLTWKFWPRPGSSPAPSEAVFEPGLPPAVAALAILLSSIGSVTSFAAEVPGAAISAGIPPDRTPGEAIAQKS